MGVTGLWGILEPTGKPVRIQTLKGKVLSVDVSIWLHQAVKGFRDKDGNPLRNAHLLGVFHRVCKLLSYGIKPIFVFDGGVPALKKQTMSVRRQRKIEAQDKSHISRNKLLQNLLKQQLQKQYLTDLPPTIEIEQEVDRVLKASERSLKKTAADSSSDNKISSNNRNKKSTSPQKQPRSKVDEEFDDHFGKFREKLTENFNNFALFFNELDKQYRSESDSDESDLEYNDTRNHNHRDYDENFSSIVSPTFDELPLEVQHEMLFDMQESKKNNSWGKIDQMPKDLQNFSSFQMERLRKRRTLQKKIQSVQKEMGQRHIHLSNFDDLAAFNYEDDADVKDTKIVGSKEKGLLYVTATAGSSSSSQQETVAEPVAGPSSSHQGQPGKGSQADVITIDDFVTEGWSSSDDEGVAVGVHVNGVRKAVHTAHPSKKSTDRELTEEEQLQEAIRLSLAQHDESGATSGTFDVSRTKSKFLNAPATSNTSGDPETKRKPIGIVNPFHSHGSKSSSILPGICESPSVSEMNGNSKFNLHKNDAGRSPSSSDSESEFEEVIGTQENDDVGSESEGKKPKLDLETMFDGVKEEIPILTIDVDNLESLKAEEDLFADIFEKVELKAEDGKIVSMLPDTMQSRNAKVDIETVEEVKAEDRCELNHSKELHLQFLSKITKTEEREKQKTIKDKNEFEGESSDSDLENVDIDIIVPVPEPTASLASDVHLTNECESNQNKNQQINRTLGSDPTKSVRMISAQYMQAQEKLVDEKDKLMSAKGFQDRVATSITDQMYSEAQELLSLFGVPFLISPMEAESQCAFLDIACLTEGTITDDSDVWLFGGQRVYKNFFSQGDRQLQLYQYADIVSKLSLDREKLVLIGILTGSDYTNGVEGVGPVKALEILSEFPSLTISAFDSLIQFRDWLEKAHAEKQLDKENTIRNKFRKIKLRSGFPSKAVYDAYMDPTIDDSTEPFRWGQPDLDGLRAYSKNKFGWDQSRCDANLLPLIKTLGCQMEETTRQLSMDSFLTFGERHSAKNSKRKIKSKRLENAMKKLKFPDHSSDIKLSSESESDSSDGEGNDFKNKNTGSGSSQQQQRKIKKQAIGEKKQNAHANSEGEAEGGGKDMDAELKDLLERMGVKRMTVKRGGDGNEDSSCPAKISKKGKQKFQKSSQSQASNTALSSSQVLGDFSTPIQIPTPSVSVSPPKPPPKKSQIIHQKAREEHVKMMQKKKAIELFKAKKK